jgi:hypothetical protein
MFHILSPNEVYDIINESKIELNLFKGKDKMDIAQFLDDVSLWMDKNRDSISDNYLPFCVLSVGVAPMQVSAFMYGLFVGKAMEKHKLKVQMSSTKIDKDTMLKDIQKNTDSFDGLLGDNFRDKPKENNDDGGQKKPRK